MYGGGTHIMCAGKKIELSEKRYAHLSISDMFEDHLLQSILTLVQDGICFLSKDLDVLYANPAMRFWYELDDGLIARKCYETYHRRTEPCENCPAIKSMESGIPEAEEQIYEIDHKRKGWQRVFCMPIQDSEEGTMLIIEYVRDITNERKTKYSMELMQNQIDALSNIIKQKEREREEKNQLFIGNMNRSIDVVLRYLEKLLDEHSYKLVQSQLKITNNGLDQREAVSGKLSGNELLIARYIANGYMSKEIADKMNLSKKTVDYHRTNIRKKLNLKPEENLKFAILEYFSGTGISQI